MSNWIPVLMGVLLGLTLSMCGCGGSAFSAIDGLAGDAGGVDGFGVGETPEASTVALDSASPIGSQAQNDGSEMRPDPSDDAGASLRDAGTTPAVEASSPPPVDAEPPREASPPPLCAPTSCPVCAVGYACCASSTVCGCENPSEGGQCR